AFEDGLTVSERKVGRQGAKVGVTDPGEEHSLRRHGYHHSICLIAIRIVSRAVAGCKEAPAASRINRPIDLRTAPIIRFTKAFAMQDCDTSRPPRESRTVPVRRVLPAFSCRWYIECLMRGQRSLWSFTHHDLEGFDVPMRHEISCINKSDRPNPHERITHVGGRNPDGTRWKVTQQDAVQGIRNGRGIFLCRRGHSGVEVVVGVSRFTHFYLKTQADGEIPDTLLSLPECP